MPEFTKVASLEQLTSAGKMLVEVEERLVALFSIDGRLYCIDDVCTHDGGPLSEGPLEGTTIACPRHGARFDLCTGEALTMPATEATAVHEVKIEGDDVLVRIKP
jgi:3-phenylpropionate/trans-cinnamate dioxygenase ferredoxin subunit